jgi:serine/threonine-protein kinase
VKNCPVCGKEYPDNVKFCPVDGSTLRAKSPTADLVGQVIADRYHIIKKLGEGGMGAVYLGEHVKMGRKSAIKVMNPGMAADPDAISRFNREASNASRISHPNVCQIYDFGETTEGVIYLAMEFIEGSALTDLIEKEGALPPARAGKILKQSADALASAHDLGIVHRDLKPDNIMIVQGRDGSDIVKVVDFGIAKAVAGDEAGQKVTKTGLVVGTPEYMSPEQLSGDKLDGRSDIYSLGLVFYRMLTGVLPFQADSAQETMIKRLTDEPMPLETARPDIVFPAKLQAVLDKALARMPSERYANASQFGKDAEAAVAGLAPAAAAAAVGESAATQLMDAEAALKSIPTKQKAPPPTAVASAAPAAPAKKFPLVPVLGGVGGVAVLAVVGVLALGGGKKPPPVAVADSTKAGAPAPNPGPTGTQTPANPQQPQRPSQNANNQRTVSQPPRQAQPGPSNPAPGGGAVTVAVCEDSANAATRAAQNNQPNDARRMARWVFYQDAATPKQKADMGELISTTYESEPDQALQWLRNALPFATGAQRTRVQTLITSLGGQP